MTPEHKKLKKEIEKASKKFCKQFEKIEAFTEKHEPECHRLRQILDELQKQCKHDDDVERCPIDNMKYPELIFCAICNENLTWTPRFDRERLLAEEQKAKANQVDK